MTYEHRRTSAGLGDIRRRIVKPEGEAAQARQPSFRDRVLLTIDPCPSPVGLHPGAAYAELVEWIPDHGPRVVDRIDGISCHNGRSRSYMFSYRTRFGYRYQIYIWNLTHQTPEFFGYRFKALNLRWQDGRLVPA